MRIIPYPATIDQTRQDDFYQQGLADDHIRQWQKFDWRTTLRSSIAVFVVDTEFQLWKAVHKTFEKQCELWNELIVHIYGNIGKPKTFWQK